MGTHHYLKKPKIVFFCINMGTSSLLFLLLWLLLRLEWFWAWWSSASLVTFCTYGYDKAQAKRDGQRVPEIILHIMAISGGVAGAWAGRGLFRHKTRHSVITIVLIIATILHLVLLVVVIVTCYL
jgi:uncharacterized membrane protein YsdA (DUF1294 family)